MSLEADLLVANETAWQSLGTLAAVLQQKQTANVSFENALRFNRFNVIALSHLATAAVQNGGNYTKAIEYFQRILTVDANNSEVWGALGHCFLMTDELEKAYKAYQKALLNVPSATDPNLWYGIGILYDRYQLYDFAEEAFSSVLRMEPKFEKASEVHFRLGLIYKLQKHYNKALQSFRAVLENPQPLTAADVWYQIGLVFEEQPGSDVATVIEAYQRALEDNPNHSGAAAHLGWVYYETANGNQHVLEAAVSHLMLSIEADPSPGITWYKLGRTYMLLLEYKKAYDAYQQAVFREGRNAMFWCSIGALYFVINQYRDALDAYHRAIRLNPNMPEVWYNLGTLYEACNQTSDAQQTYKCGTALAPDNKFLSARLALISADGGAAPGAAEASKLPQTIEPPLPHGESAKPSAPAHDPKKIQAMAGPGGERVQSLLGGSANHNSKHGDDHHLHNGGGVGGSSNSSNSNNNNNNILNNNISNNGNNDYDSVKNEFEEKRQSRSKQMAAEAAAAAAALTGRSKRPRPPTATYAE